MALYQSLCVCFYKRNCKQLTVYLLQTCRGDEKEFPQIGKKYVNKHIVPKQKAPPIVLSALVQASKSFIIFSGTFNASFRTSFIICFSISPGFRISINNSSTGSTYSTGKEEPAADIPTKDGVDNARDAATVCPATTISEKGVCTHLWITAVTSCRTWKF